MLLLRIFSFKLKKLRQRRRVDGTETRLWLEGVQYVPNAEFAEGSLLLTIASLGTGKVAMAFSKSSPMDMNRVLTLLSDEILLGFADMSLSNRFIRAACCVLRGCWFDGSVRFNLSLCWDSAVVMNTISRSLSSLFCMFTICLGIPFWDQFSAMRCLPVGFLTIRDVNKGFDTYLSGLFAFFGFSTQSHR
jgi:hypothetical protein